MGVKLSFPFLGKVSGADSFPPPPFRLHAVFPIFLREKGKRKAKVGDNGMGKLLSALLFGMGTTITTMLRRR